MNAQSHTVDPIPPHNLEAEMALLGSVLVDGGMMPAVSQIVRPEDFYAPLHESIYRALYALYESDRPIDKVAAFEELGISRTLDKTEALAYLTRLIDSVSTTASAQYHAMIVREKSSLRDLASAAERIWNVANDAEHDAPTAHLLSETILAAVREPCPVSVQNTSRLNFVDWGTVRIEPVEWLMRGLPFAELTILEGDGGLGKTCFTLDIAARGSRGAGMPDGTRLQTPFNTVIVAQEDRAAVIKARLLAADADLGRIHLLDSVATDKHFFSLPSDVDALRRSVTQHNARLVIIDALFSHFDAGINAHKAQDVRRALTPLSDAAHETHAAYVGIRHWGKGARSAADRGMGSVDIRNIARSVLTVAKHPDDEGRVVVAVSKSNLGQPGSALTFSLISTDVSDEGGTCASMSVARVVWGDEVDITADELANTSLPHAEDGAERDVADDFLSDFISQPTPANEVFAAAERVGLKRRTIQRAAARMKVRIERRGFGKGSIWSPPTPGQESRTNVEVEL